MPVDQRYDPEGLVSLISGYRFLELAARKEKLRELGVATALRTSTYELGAYGAALRDGATILEYLEHGTRLVTTLCSGGTRFWLRREGAQLRVQQHLAGPDGLGVQIADVYTLVITITMLQHLIGPDWLPGELRLRAGVEHLLGDWQVPEAVAVFTDQPLTSFTLPCSVLSRPVPAVCARTISNHSPASRVVPLMPIDFLSSMQQLVQAMVVAECPDIRSTAKAANLSSRTLQRRLAQHGTSYRSLVSAARLNIAQERLRRQNATRHLQSEGFSAPGRTKAWTAKFIDSVQGLPRDPQAAPSPASTVRWTGPAAAAYRQRNGISMAGGRATPSRASKSTRTGCGVGSNTR